MASRISLTSLSVVCRVEHAPLAPAGLWLEYYTNVHGASYSVVFVVSVPIVPCLLSKWLADIALRPQLRTGCRPLVG